MLPQLVLRLIISTSVRFWIKCCFCLHLYFHPAAANTAWPKVYGQPCHHTFDLFMDLQSTPIRGITLEWEHLPSFVSASEFQWREVLLLQHTMIFKTTALFPTETWRVEAVRAAHPQTWCYNHITCHTDVMLVFSHIFGHVVDIPSGARWFTRCVLILWRKNQQISVQCPSESVFLQGKCFSAAGWKSSLIHIHVHVVVDFCLPRTNNTFKHSL